jgi:hypothetical protein
MFQELWNLSGGTYQAARGGIAFQLNLWLKKRAKNKKPGVERRAQPLFYFSGSARSSTSSSPYS